MDEKLKHLISTNIQTKFANRDDELVLKINQGRQLAAAKGRTGSGGYLSGILKCHKDEAEYRINEIWNTIDSKSVF